MGIKSYIKFTTVVLIVFGFFASMGHSQDPSQGAAITVKADFTKDTIMIGDQIELRVTVNKDIMYETGFPEFNNGFGGVIEILNQSEIDTIGRDGRNITIYRDYLVTCFDAGKYNIGKFPVLNIQKNRVDTVFSIDSIKLFVAPIAIDTTKNIIDIKEQIGAPLRYSEIEHYVYYGLLALLVLAVIIYFVRKYLKKRAERALQKPLLPPHIEAMNELEKLYIIKLWKGGRHKIYYTKLSDIIRVYIERRYDVGAMEMTSDETLIGLRDKLIPTVSENKLREFLILSDLVKFAKFIPTEEEIELSFNHAYDFVEQTKLTVMDSEKEELK